jgi:hypothetical protein
MREPTMKMTFASKSIGLRPKISLILPQDGIDAALANVNEAPIHV